MFLITHDLDTLYEICDRVAVLADGKVIAVGTIPELLATDHPWIQEYFNGPRGRAAPRTPRLRREPAAGNRDGQARPAAGIGHRGKARWKRGPTHVWVGAVSLLLLACSPLFIVWLAQLGNADRKEYDIFFKQSVDGLAKGSEVTFAGRARRARSQDIELWRQGPRVRPRARSRVDEDIPILQGTTASISGQLHRRLDRLSSTARCAAPRRSPSPAPKACR